MTYLCINDLNNISKHNIHIKEYDNKYKIYYKKNNIIVNGITFYTDTIVRDNKIVKIILNDNHGLKNLDSILSQKIDNYKSFMQNNSIIIKNNDKIDSILDKNKENQYYLNLSIIYKHNNTPLLYIIK